MKRIPPFAIDAVLILLLTIPITWFRWSTSPAILFGIDECFHMVFALKPTIKEMFAMLYRVAPQQFPLDYLINFAAVRLTTDIYALRNLPLLWGAGAIAACYFLGKHLWNRTFGWLWGWMLGMSVLHTAYCQQLRPYSLILFLSLFSLLAFFKAMKNAKWVPVFGVSLFLFQLAYPFAAAFSAASVLYVGIEKPKTRRGLVFCSGLSLLIPLIWFVLIGMNLLAKPVFFYETTSNGLADFIWKVVVPFGQGTLACAVVISGLFIVGLSIALASQNFRRHAGFALGLMVLTGLMVLISMKRANLFIEARHFITLLPLFLGFAVVPLAWICRNSIITTLGSFFLTMMSFPSFQGYLAQQQEASSVLRNGALFLQTVKGPHDQIIFSNPNLAATFLYAYDKPEFLTIKEITLNKGFNLFQLPPNIYTLCSLDGAVSTIDRTAFKKLEEETRQSGGRIWLVYHRINYLDEPPPFSPHLGIDPNRMKPVYEGIYLLN